MFDVNRFRFFVPPLLFFWFPLTAAAQNNPGFVQFLIDQYEHSDIQFSRADSNAPFIPIGFLGASYYGDAQVEGPHGVALTYNVKSMEQGAGLPFFLGDKDMLLIGEYIAQTEFDFDTTIPNRFDVTSVGLPVGWLRQLNPQWQLISFVMPFGHYNHVDGGVWNWQYMGGLFARYEQSNNLWWAYGIYADVTPGDDFYIPYLGAYWSINRQWTIEAIMPWPAVAYAPNQDWMFRLGASPSSASWSFNAEEEADSINLDAWDFGLGVEHRIQGNVWLGLEAGVGGLRAFRFTQGGSEAADIDVSSGAYIELALRYRPALD